MTFAQDPKTAQWPAMPMNAITAGSVDFVLPPRRLAAELARIGRHPYLAEAREVPQGSELDRICANLRSAVGVDFLLYKQPTVRRRIARRMALQKIASLTKYARILKQNPEEAKALADDIFIHVTSFFRDPECFQALRAKVLTKLCLKRPAGDPLRIWVAGCSTGEEVYSIAMLLLEELGNTPVARRFRSSGPTFRRARSSMPAPAYTPKRRRRCLPARLKRFFVRTDHGYQIQKFVRDLCVFARHDLAKRSAFLEARSDQLPERTDLHGPGPAEESSFDFPVCAEARRLSLLGNSESISEHSDSSPRRTGSIASSCAS